ncbi:serine/threonine protein kinase, CMGC family, CDC2/CDK subfamily [Polyplosphaeria fusca]|uniref:cyclin-dependent kinase n=1 Tax=Polyplosphaeria fusca TaxID=682080 RepID=A0A9P4V061_9PLEO|nr:serine/threonine protein kinase, CMGC family, CDC2/CDK subfamily [Polyplosphaeria fusca]
MAGASRWADEEGDRAEKDRRKKEKEEKKRAKLAKQQAEEEAKARAEQRVQRSDERPSKKRKLSPDGEEDAQPQFGERKLLRFEAPGWGPCRHTSNFETLNHIEEGSYGWVSRAKAISTGEVVALKKIKMDYNQDGFPITALREISILQQARHANIVDLREIVMGNGLDDVVMVMEFIEHDLKTLEEDMFDPFKPSEVKTLLRQLGSAVGFLHENHIMHRDLKTSNILLNNRGQLKLADFGMARHVPPPHAPLTQLVVTLWYRAPELLLGAEDYGPEIDMWSIGCIFGELLSKEPILQGKDEVDELSKIFALCGLPNDKTWPGFYRLPNAKALKIPRDTKSGSVIRSKFTFLTNAGAELLTSLLSLNPAGRPTAKQMLQHPYFTENPRPMPPEMFPSFPSKAGQEKRRKHSPNAPRRGDAPKIGGGELDFSSIFAGREEEQKGAGFQLRIG